jgi:hypothetical protein
MRHSRVLGVGLAGLLTGSAAVGQFASDRMPAAPQPKAAVPFAGAQPAPVPAGQPIGTPAAGAPAAQPGVFPAPVGGFQPAAPAGAPPGPGLPPATPAVEVEIPSALGPNHPLALRPEHGNWFICVKSYARPGRPDPSDPGPTARELAEALATEIREAHPGVGVYLFEHVSEEKRAEAAARAQARQRAAEFAAALDRYRQQSQLQFAEFLGSDHKVRYQTFNYRDQIAVLVGGYRTQEEAIKALAKVRTWQPPKNQLLMDGGAIVKPGPDGKPVIEKSRLNPFPQSMVVPNPAAPKADRPAGGLDPFVVKLNEGRPYSLLKATKPWTLAVKSFSAPVTIQSMDDEGGMMRKLGFGKGGDALAAGAEQAETLAKALRDPRMKPRPFDAFVLHTRTASIVTVGEFDSPNDPALLETRRILMGLTFNLSRDEKGTEMTGARQRLFGDNIMPIPVPRTQ